MRYLLSCKLILAITVLFICAATGTVTAQIANSYPNDIGIGNDPSVVLVEMFEQSTINSMLNTPGYQTLSNLSNIAFDASVPVGSPGSQSCKLTTIETSTNPNEPDEDTNIRIDLSSDISDSVFVRYYIKYNNDFRFHHSGVWMGGTNTNLSCWPCHRANTVASGDSAFRVGSEVRGATMSAQNNAKFGLYNYWMGQHPNNSGVYLANEFHNSGTADIIDMNEWNCIEVMIKLNNPVSALNGEAALWINGVKISHHGYQFPDGTWSQTHFTEGTGTPFEGYQWRSNPAVMFNYIWIKNFSDNNTSTLPNDILFDHIVVAKSYIGPIFTNPTGIAETGISVAFRVYPNPADNIIKLSKAVKRAELYNVYGKQVMVFEGETDNISTAGLEDGVYLLRADNAFHKIIVKH